MTQWRQAELLLIGITPIMDFCRDHYGTKYAPNTRETFRQADDAPVHGGPSALANPDEPDRACQQPQVVLPN